MAVIGHSAAKLNRSTRLTIRESLSLYGANSREFWPVTTELFVIKPLVMGDYGVNSNERSLQTHTVLRLGAVFSLDLWITSIRTKNPLPYTKRILCWCSFSAFNSAFCEPPRRLPDNPPPRLCDNPPPKLCENPPQWPHDNAPWTLRDRPPRRLRDDAPPKLWDNAPPRMPENPPRRMRDNPPRKLRDNPPRRMCCDPLDK